MPLSKSPNPFYLNIILLNKAELVTKRVNERTGLSSSRFELHTFMHIDTPEQNLLLHTSGIFFGMIGKAAASVANKILTDEKLIENISSTLIEKM
jgi:hypothetical protein